VILLCFVVLPFTYYYAEEVLVSEDGGDFMFGREESSSEDEEDDGEAETDKELSGGRAGLKRWMKKEAGGIKKAAERAKKAAK
jgi:hypothetical protein